MVGGAEVTTEEEEILGLLPNIDFAVSGEGEHTFCELLECIRGKGDVAKVKGLLYRDDTGNILKNEARPFEPDLEKFPYPDRILFRYPYEFHSIIGTRGCPYKCTFCNSSSNWRYSYRLRKPETIAEEIQYVLNLYGNRKYFAFNDDSCDVRGGVSDQADISL